MSDAEIIKLLRSIDMRMEATQRLLVIVADNTREEGQRRLTFPITPVFHADDASYL